jgi:hypothetical protein
MLAAADEVLPAHGAWLESARFRAALHEQNADADGKYAPTFTAIALALGTLAATDALAFASLGLYPEDTAVPEAVVAATWRMPPATARALLERLQAAGLAKLEVAEVAGGVAAGAAASGVDGAASGAPDGAAVGAAARSSGGAAPGSAPSSSTLGVAVMLHDLARDFAAALCAAQAGGTAAWHANLLARLAKLIPLGDEAAAGACRPWWRLGETAHGIVAAFVAEHLLSHLRAAGLRDEAAALAFRLPWLQFALRRRGALALVAAETCADPSAPGAAHITFGGPLPPCTTRSGASTSVDASTSCIRSCCAASTSGRGKQRDR